MAWSQSSPSSHAGAVTRGTEWEKLASQLHLGWKWLPSPWLKAGPQLFNISMKPVKGYRYVKWPCQRLAAQLLLCKTALNGPAPCVPSPSWGLVGVGGGVLRTSYIFFSNISWTPWVLDPIINPYLPTSPWLPPVTICFQETYKVKIIFIVYKDVNSLLTMLSFGWSFVNNGR